MEQLSLTDVVNKENPEDFSNLFFESPSIKRVEFECEDVDFEIFLFKEILRTQRVPNLKKKTIEFRVISDFIKDGELFQNSNDFKKEQEARDFFEGHKAHLLFLKEKNEENKVFDGRRYFWVIDKDDNLTNERGWD